MSAPSPDIKTARANLDRLLERRERALEGKDRMPDPTVVRAAEGALLLAEEREGANNGE